MKVLLSSRKAQLARRIEKLGMHVADFSYFEDERANTWEFQYQKGPYRFAYHGERITFCPGGFTFEEDIKSFTCRFWLFAKTYFSSWLRYLHREISSGDPWKQLSDKAVMVDAVPSPQPFSNTRFTSAELSQIERTVNDIKSYISSQGIPSPERQNAIEL